MKRFLFLFLLALPGIALHATHIVGGELTYKCLGNNDYEFTLTVYRDCYTGVPPFDTVASIGIFDASWKLVEDVRIHWNPASNDTLPIILSNPCLAIPPDVCAHGTMYKVVVKLPFRPGGYTAVYQRCCRNELIQNIIDPLKTGISIVSVITEEALLACNNSATFNEWPPVAICIHYPIDFDHSATDADGDSLVYRLCTPLHGGTVPLPMPQPPKPGPYAEVQWKNPFGLQNVLGGDPLSIDPATGFLTGVPNTIGNCVVGVCVDEYRGDTLLSTTRRDFQYNVADCGVPSAAFFLKEKNCLGAPVSFVNQSTATTYRWYFDWENNPGLTSAAHSPKYVYPDTGYYTVALISAPGQPCADTAFQKIYVGLYTIGADMTVAYPFCDNNGLFVQAFDQSTDTLYGVKSWNWYLTGSNTYIYSSQQNAAFLLPRPGTYQLRLIAESDVGCRDTVDFHFDSPVPVIDSLREALTICKGDTVRLNSGGVPDYGYHWAPHPTLSDTTAVEPLAYPLESTDYFVTVTNSFCTYEGQVSVSVAEPASLTLSADPDTIYLGQSSQLEALFPGDIKILWEPPESVSNFKIPTPLATPTETTTYTAQVVLGSDCIVSRQVTVVVVVPLCDEPYLFFPTGFSPNGDGENDVLRLEGTYVEEVYWAIYNRWGQKVFETSEKNGAWDGTFHGEPQPAETYGYYLRMRCPGGEETLKKGNVTLLR